MDIKFRGKDRRGNIFFGTYDEKTATIDDFDYASSHVVEHETVAQLATHDDEDNEVYTGDKVIGPDGRNYTSKLVPMFLCDDDDTLHLFDPNEIHLKE